MKEYSTCILFSLSIMVNTITLNLPSQFIGNNQADNHDTKQIIKICTAKITEIGRTSSFRFNYMLGFSTQMSGVGENFQKLRWKGDEKLLNTKDLLPCIKTWVLEPNKKYVVSLSLGTTSGPNTIIISNMTDKESFQIEL